MYVDNTGISDFTKSMITISEFAKLVGISAACLRNYDRDNIFRPAVVLPSGRRMYSINQVTEYKEQFTAKNHSNKLAPDSLDITVIYLKKQDSYAEKIRAKAASYIDGTKSTLVKLEDVDNSFVDSTVLFCDDTDTLKSIDKDGMSTAGLIQLGRFLTSHSKVKEILVCLDESHTFELDALNRVKFLGKIFGIAVTNIY